MSAETADLLPRNSYFHAVDRQMETDSYPSKIIPTEQGRRHKLLTLAIQDAENLIGALKTAKHFDRLGNIEHALPQIADALADVVTKAQNFVSDVEVSTARYRGVVADSSNEAAGGQSSDPAAAVESPDVPAAAASTSTEPEADLVYFEWQDPTAHAVPKPGPHLASVKVFDPSESPSAQLLAFDRAAGAHKAARR
ncbi:hypothetical protein [Paenarthrobacter nitroguajacolicus]|uniref:hypothetical protein n=1 Tax=Paenarthrobacter nitroguajacolicus TaxID=211146 RepID=UPI0015BE36C4|nr:hypothetical protein [Paenarthrobacter nitroguajacolicus]NWL32950.1 hypothetical protein [Paenarthrobacter nitroguajacolicus]